MSDCYGCVCGRAHTHEEDEARAEKAEAALADLQEDMGDGERERDDLRAKLAAAEHNVQHWHSLETKAQSERRTAEEELVGVRVKLSDERDAAVARGDSLQTAVKLLEFEKAEAVARGDEFARIADRAVTRAERAEAKLEQWQCGGIRWADVVDQRDAAQARVARLEEALGGALSGYEDSQDPGAWEHARAVLEEGK